MDAREIYLASVYGLHPHALPPALYYPMLPPAARGAPNAPSWMAPGPAARLPRGAQTLMSQLDSHMRAHRAAASGMLAMPGAGLAGAVHPLHAAGAEAAALRRENDRLQKENADLRAGLRTHGGAPRSPTQA